MRRNRRSNNKQRQSWRRPDRERQTAFQGRGSASRTPVRDQSFSSSPPQSFSKPAPHHRGKHSGGIKNINSKNSSSRNNSSNNANDNISDAKGRDTADDPHGFLLDRFHFLALTLVGQHVEVDVVDKKKGKKTYVGMFKTFGPFETNNDNIQKGNGRKKNKGKGMDVILISVIEKGAPATTVPEAELFIDGQDMLQIRADVDMTAIAVGGAAV